MSILERSSAIKEAQYVLNLGGTVKIDFRPAFTKYGMIQIARFYKTGDHRGTHYAEISADELHKEVKDLPGIISEHYPVLCSTIYSMKPSATEGYCI